jgi:uncharacterized membrane protein
MLVAVFDSEYKARGATMALQALSERSAIGLGTDAVVTKIADGTTTIAKTHRLRPEGTMGGTALGLLIGLYGGFTGLAVGAATGFTLGAVSDFIRSRVDGDFVRDVAHSLEPGRSALVAEIDEDFTDAVNAQMEALGARVFRRDLSEVADIEYETEASALKAAFARRKARRAVTRAERVRRLRAAFDSFRRKLAQGPMKEL